MNYLIGVEREGLRIRPDGTLADTPHPEEFGDRVENPLIGTDFGEAMLELRTRPQANATACYEELWDVTRRALALLYSKGELLWPYSMPCELPGEAHFRYNPYPGRPDKEAHERFLTKFYELRRNCICGVHVNFSVGDDTLTKMRRLYPSMPVDKDEAYLKCARQILRHETVLRHFFDASPTDFEAHVVYENYLRNSPKGFRNEKALLLDYSSKAAYLQSLKRMESYERLSAIRLKSADPENFDEGIAAHGIDRLEFRLCDIDPFDICGVSLYETELVVAVLFACMAKDELPDEPAGLLAVCTDTDEKLRLGLEKAIRFYQERESDGVTKCGRVRALLAKKGMDGLRALALRHGKTATKKR